MIALGYKGLPLLNSGFIYNTFGNIFEGGLIARGGLFNLAKCINGSKVSRGRTCGYMGRYTAFSNNKKMVTILHRELEHKVENVQHMKLEVMRSKTKSNRNFQPE